ncbi:hypothetical protein SteCoe_6551 [Stentor coeruleus]|uniref:Uncharacterized protein n=1 Tax=Stentor coeruleus TaxID=5963 RepID=A0A1R2CPT4_9CILI|nr:hypothetical protein SteCoe_6551 [Stentor coeruleus]
MGACAAKQKLTKRQFNVIELPYFIYVDRSAKEIQEISSTKRTKIDFNNPFHICRNSIIGYSPLGLIYIIGGVKRNNKATKKGSELNFKEKTSKPLQKFPQKLFQGQILFNGSTIYVINSHNTSIYTLNSSSNTWSLLNIDFPSNSSTKIHDFSCCIHNNYLYLIGGYYIQNDHNTDFYGINLAKGDFIIRKTALSLPIKLTNPKCLITNNYKIVGGGRCENGSMNCKFFVNTGNFDVWNVVECSSYDPRDNYPAFDIGGLAFFVSYSTALAFNNDVFVVFKMKSLDNEDVKDHFESKKEISVDTLKGHSTDEKTLSKSPEKIEKLKPSDEDLIEFGDIPQSKSRSSSDSESFILRARVLTPINRTFRETISSIESGDSSQILYSDEEISIENPQVANQDSEDKFIENEDDNLSISDMNESKYKSKSAKNSEITNELKILSNKKTISDQQLQKIHNIEILINYSQAKEFVNFMFEVLQVKSNEKLPEKIKNFTLYHFEKILLKFRYKLYPIETFKILIQALDLIFRAKKLTKKEKKAFEEVVGLKDNIKFIKKPNFISGVLLRVKFIVLKEKQNS